VSIPYAALSNHGAWEIALIIGLVAALAVAGLLAVLVRTVNQIDESAGALLDVAGQVAGNTAYIPNLQATAPVLGQIVTEAVVQDGYMNALTDGFGGLGPRATADGPQGNGAPR
jgi:predicted permease